MRKLFRIRDDDKLSKDLKGAKLSAKLLRLIEKRLAFVQGSFDIPSGWGGAKKTLFEESSFKCAYCESEVPSTYPGSVEHYRPKSIYWWLAYSIDNYVVSCSSCNAFKSNEFEIVKKIKEVVQMPKSINDKQGIQRFIKTYALDPSSPTIDTSQVGLEYLRNCERPKFINPYLDDPVEYFQWNFSEALQEVEIIPKKNLTRARKRNAAYTIELVRLNRMGLKRQRFALANLLKKFILFGAQESDLAPLFFAPECEYSSMCRYLHSNHT